MHNVRQTTNHTQCSSTKDKISLISKRNDFSVCISDIKKRQPQDNSESNLNVDVFFPNLKPMQDEKKNDQEPIQSNSICFIQNIK